MNLETRLRTCRLIEKMQRDVEQAKALGLQNISQFNPIAQVNKKNKGGLK